MSFLWVFLVELIITVRSNPFGIKTKPHIQNRSLMSHISCHT